MLERRGHASIPANFATTDPPHDAARPHKPRMPTTAHRNPQTVCLLDMLQLPYNLDLRDAPRDPPPCPGELKPSSPPAPASDRCMRIIMC